MAVKTVADLITVVAFVVSTGYGLWGRSSRGQSRADVADWRASPMPSDLALLSERQGRERAEREIESLKRQLQEPRAREPAGSEKLVCEVFLCWRCGSFWILTRRPTDTTVYPPPSGGCPECVPFARTPGFSDDRIDEDPIESSAGRSACDDEAVELVADVLDDDPQKALAEHIVEVLDSRIGADVRSATSADHCRGLNTTAETLDGARKSLADAGGRVVVFLSEIVGTPELLARLFGEITRRVVAAKLEPMRTLALTVRAAGVAACRSAEERERCACRAPLAREATEEITTEVLHEVIKARGQRLEAADSDSGRHVLLQDRQAGTHDEAWAHRGERPAHTKRNPAERTL